MALLAQVRTDAPPSDKRATARRVVRLEVDAMSTAGATRAVIHNLSERGLLVETIAEGLAVGKAIEVELPEVGTIRAMVVWSRGQFFGCEFLSPVAKAAVSAALLRSPVHVPAPPADILHMLEGHSPHQSDRFDASEDVSQWLVIASLVVSLLTVGLFILALLRFPFST